MGVVSRRVVPACGSLCCFCPSLRARSRQPVKRYKKLLSDIFPRNQEAEPNDRKIGKLCEYVSKNPLRIPKITDTLEQRFYKELRHENYGSVKVVLCIYRKLLSSCKEQMPLFSSSLLGIVRTLLEQTRQDELRILSCSTLVDFISAQKDSTYMFNLEGLIPKLCQLAEEEGDGERIILLRSSGLQVLASLVNFMGEHSHISMDFDNIISATLENYNDCQRSLENSGENQWVKEVLKAEENSSSFPDMSKKVSLPNVNNAEVKSSMDTSKSPAYWSRVCLRNMAALAKEATTVRRVLEPLFHNFDVNNYWSSEKGLAYPILLFLQSLLEESGENSHLILSILAKHLDHRNVSKQPTKQLEIVNVITKLGQNAKQQASVAIIGSTSELMKHLRKCLQTSVELSTAENGANNTNADLLCALEKCISVLSNKVGDAGPLLDSMAVFLENITSTAIVARATVSSALRTAQIISSIPNTSYQKKTFPDALFHQLLVAMAHPDHETRIGAHSIFSVVLMPSLLLPWSDHNKGKWANPDYFGTVEKAKRESFAFQDESKDKQDVTNTRLSKEDGEISDVVAKQSTECDSHDHSNSFKCALPDVKTLSSLRLSSHQISLLLSSLWVQAASTDNMPVNFESMGHTFNIALQFTRTKASGHMVLVRCFQLAFSLRSISLDHEGGLQPSRRRSLFTLASYMLVISARAGNLPELIPFVKASLTDETVDPYLELVEDTLQSAPASDNGKVTYGSEDDNVAASKSLSAVELNDNQLKEMLVSQFTMKFRKLSQDELHIIKKQLLEEFSPDDSYPLGAPFFMETPRPSSPLVQVEFQAFQEIFPAAVLTDDDTLTEINGSQSDRKTSLSVNTLDILGVDELMESVLETARQVASSQVSSKPVPYDQMKSQCEALVTGKQQKMSMLHSFKINQQEVKVFPSDKKATAVLEMIQKVDLSQDSFKPETDDKIHALDQLTVYSHGNAQSSFRLPPSSPYDKFLKAAGC